MKETLMETCWSCGKIAAVTAELSFCEEHQRLVTALLATMKPGITEEGFSEARRLLILKMQKMALDLADATIAVSDSELTDISVARTFEAVEGMWAVFSAKTGGKKLRQLLN